MSVLKIDITVCASLLFTLLLSWTTCLPVNIRPGADGAPVPGFNTGGERDGEINARNTHLHPFSEHEEHGEDVLIPGSGGQAGEGNPDEGENPDGGEANRRETSDVAESSTRAQATEDTEENPEKEEIPNEEENPDGMEGEIHGTGHEDTHTSEPENFHQRRDSGSEWLEPEATEASARSAPHQYSGSAPAGPTFDTMWKRNGDSGVTGEIPDVGHPGNAPVVVEPVENQEGREGTGGNVEAGGERTHREQGPAHPQREGDETEQSTSRSPTQTPTTATSTVSRSVADHPNGVMPPHLGVASVERLHASGRSTRTPRADSMQTAQTHITASTRRVEGPTSTYSPVNRTLIYHPTPRPPSRAGAQKPGFVPDAGGHQGLPLVPYDNVIPSPSPSPLPSPSTSPTTTTTTTTTTTVPGPTDTTDTSVPTTTKMSTETPVTTVSSIHQPGSDHFAPQSTETETTSSSPEQTQHVQSITEDSAINYHLTETEYGTVTAARAAQQTSTTSSTGRENEAHSGWSSQDAHSTSPQLVNPPVLTTTAEIAHPVEPSHSRASTTTTDRGQVSTREESTSSAARIETDITASSPGQYERMTPTLISRSRQVFATPTQTGTASPTAATQEQTEVTLSSAPLGESTTSSAPRGRHSNPAASASRSAETQITTRTTSSPAQLSTSTQKENKTFDPLVSEINRTTTSSPSGVTQSSTGTTTSTTRNQGSVAWTQNHTLITDPGTTTLERKLSASSTVPSENGQHINSTTDASAVRLPTESDGIFLRNNSHSPSSRPSSSLSPITTPSPVSTEMEVRDGVSERATALSLTPSLTPISASTGASGMPHQPAVSRLSSSTMTGANVSSTTVKPTKGEDEYIIITSPHDDALSQTHPTTEVSLELTTSFTGGDTSTQPTKLPSTNFVTATPAASSSPSQSAGNDSLPSSRSGGNVRTTSTVRTTPEARPASASTSGVPENHNQNTDHETETRTTETQSTSVKTNIMSDTTRTTVRVVSDTMTASLSQPTTTGRTESVDNTITGSGTDQHGRVSSNTTHGKNNTSQHGTHGSTNNSNTDADSNRTNGRTNHTSGSSNISSNNNTENRSGSDNDSRITTTTTTTTTTSPDNGLGPILPPNGEIDWGNDSMSIPLEPSLPLDLPMLVEIKLRMTWSEFCSNEPRFCVELVDIFREQGQQETITTDQIRLTHANRKRCVDEQVATVLEAEEIEIQLYLVNKTNHYDGILTLQCAQIIKQGFDQRESSLFKNKLLDVRLQELEEEEDIELEPGTDGHKPPKEEGHESSNNEGDEDSLISQPGVTIAVVIAAVGGVCCIVLIVMQIVLRRRYRDGLRALPSRTYSATSVDSIALAAVAKSRPNSGLFNPALDLAPEALQGEPSHPMNLTELSNFCLDLRAVYEEFQLIPNKTPRLSVVPAGAEDKNRYANILPIPGTRVRLDKRAGNEALNYINANFVSGYKGDQRTYIATQAPLEATVGDFWRMVWEQQSRAIVMLINLQEDGHTKCATYFPDSIGHESSVQCGEYDITMTKRDVHQEYITSWLQIRTKDGETRDVRHFWLTCWPLQGRPEPISLVRFVLDSRPQYEDSGAPLVVHCSNGTGRTGTFLALDICMRQYEDRRTVDVMRCVHAMRQERAGCVQTSEQYALVYNALQEYATILSSPAISAASSAATLHTNLI